MVPLLYLFITPALSMSSSCFSTLQLKVRLPGLSMALISLCTTSCDHPHAEHSCKLSLPFANILLDSLLSPSLFLFSSVFPAHLGVDKGSCMKYHPDSFLKSSGSLSQTTTSLQGLKVHIEFMFK